jgi:hypothetical protein
MSDDGMNLANREIPTAREQQQGCLACEEGGCMVTGTPPVDESNEQPVIPPPPEYDPDDVAFRRELLLVYISGPMTGDGSAEAMTRNCLAAWAVHKRLAKRGFAPSCPHLSGLSPDYDELTREEWVAIDLPWVAQADAILRLHGESDGADDEVLHAVNEAGLPVFSTVEQLEAWRRGRTQTSG